MKKLLLFLMVLCAVFPVFSQQRIDQVFDLSLTTQTGTLMVYDANNSDGKVYSASNKDFNQISKMVFTPNDPDIDDQIIITVDANGTSNTDICRSNSLWMYIHNRVKLTFTTKNQRGKIKAIDFSIANAQFASRVQYFILDDSNTFYPTYDGKKTFNASKGTWNYTLNEGNDQHTVIIANSSTTTSCGFEKIKITWTPGTAEPPAIPNAEISEATEDDEGTYHFLSTASAKITGPDDADIYYTFTTDESVVEPTISDENKIASGESVTITETGRLLIQSVNKNNPNLKSAVNTYDFKKTDVVTVANIGELTKNGIHDGLGVIINCRLNTLGTYETNAENFTGRPTYYAYVRDINNNVIKLVSQGTPFPESYSAIGYHNSWGHDGLYIEPMGVAGEFRYNNGLPEIYVKSVTSDFTSYLKDATSQKAPSETWKPMSIRTDKITQDMFNRRVVLQNMKWIGENSQIEDAAGNRFQVYPRLNVPVYEYSGAATTTTKSFQQLLNNPQAGHHYQIEAFIGQNRGELLVFPIVELRETPNAPKLMAPNALDGEVNIISDQIKR
ncbi:MAG: hypothetical protein K2I18_00360, partial [Paramuribaculum sp.]|nr:hypothetical protein [Paramuribaculum sp.]